MTRLATLTAQKVLKVLQRAGFVAVKQRGSHLFLKNEVTGLETTLPMHDGDLGRGLMKKILKQAGLTEKEFRQLL